MNDQEYELLTVEEVAELLRMKPRQVNERWAYRPDVPKFVKPGRDKLWKKVEIYEYIDKLQKKAA